MPKAFADSVWAAVYAIRRGGLSAQTYMQQFLDALGVRESQIQALVYWDKELVQQQAANTDIQLPIADIPIEFKDVLDAPLLY